MSIKTIVVCDECGEDTTIVTQVHTVCQSCRSGAKELAAVRAENIALKDANAAVCEGLDATRKELAAVRARLSELEKVAKDAEDQEYADWSDNVDYE
jgi:hypothetical protein